MDKTLRTIREEIRKNRKGNIPLITLVVDTNILADYGWKRDDNVRHLFSTLAIDGYDDLLIVAPKVSKIEFKAITKQERAAWLDLKGTIDSKLRDVPRYEGSENLYNSLNESRTEINNLISALDRSLHEVLEILSNLMYFFETELPLQDSMAFYISRDPDYNLGFEDALVFSFVKLVGRSLDGESEVLFLTKDRDFADSDGFCGFQPLRPCALASLRFSDLTQSRRDAKTKEWRPRLLQHEGGLLLSTTENGRTRDFDVGSVVGELRDVNVKIYFSSDACLQRIKEVMGSG